VPNKILNKPAALTDDEMRTVRPHTLEGERMLERIGGILGKVVPVVRHHHERFDGTATRRAPGRGDPAGLARDLGLRRLPRDDLRAGPLSITSLMALGT